MAGRKRSTRTMNFAALPLDQLKCVAEIVMAAVCLRAAERVAFPLRGDVLEGILNRARESVKLQGVLFKHVDALNALLIAEEETERAARSAKRQKRARARSRKK